MGLTLAARELSVARDGRAVLFDVSCTLAPGVVTALVGPNGAGKSTLLLALAGLLPATAGSVALAGHGDVARLPPAARARLVGWAPPSEAPAFDFPVEDVVLLGRFPWHGGRPADADRELARTALARLGIAALARRSVQALSSGERQKITLARLIAGAAPVLLLDEPLANLDVASGLTLLALLADLARGGRTVCLTLHDLPLAHRHAQDVLVLQHGRLVAHGTPAESLTPATVAAVFGARAETVRTAAGAEALVIT